MQEKLNNVLAMLDNVGELFNKLEIKGKQNIVIMYGILSLMQNVVTELSTLKNEEIPKKE